MFRIFEIQLIKTILLFTQNYKTFHAVRVFEENVKTIMSMNFPYEERLYPDSNRRNHETIQYWPTVNGKTFNFMPFKITCIDSSLMVGYI